MEAPDLIRTDDMGVARKKLDRVGSLDLSGQKRSEIPKEIAEMVNLASLSLHNNYFKDIPGLLDTLSNLPKLRYLTLSLNECDRLPATIGALENLDFLILEGAHLHALPEDVARLQKLKNLELRINNWIGEEPHLKPLGKLPLLETLGLWGIGNPPRGLDHLIQVKVLIANGIRQAPIGIEGMTGLNRLQLYCGYYEATEPIHLEAITALPNLEKLIVRSNVPLTFASSMAGMSKLTEIDVEESLLEALPEGFSDLPAIKTIKANKNQIKVLPNWIGGLKTVEELQLEENKLQTLPETLPECSSLSKLRLSQNQFVEFPEVVFQSKSLREVLLGRNKIQGIGLTEAPDSGLTYLSLRMNKLEEFPWILADLPKLKLDFEGNPFVKAAGYKIDNVIFAVSATPHELQVRRTLLALAIGDIPKALQTASLASLITALDDQEAKVRAFGLEALSQFLPDPFAEGAAPSSIRIVGQTKAYPLADLKKKLESKQILVNKGKPGAVDVVVLAEKPGTEAEPYLDAGAKPATIAQLAAYIDALDQPWLRKKAGEQPKVGENFIQLLQSDSKDNLKLAMEMLSQGGMPEGAISHVLAISLVHPDAKLKAMAADAVSRYASPGIKSFLAANKRNIASMSSDKLMGHLKQFMEMEEIDARAFSMTLANIDSKFKPLFMPYMTGPEFKERILRDDEFRMHREKCEGLPPGLLELGRVRSVSLYDVGLKSVPEGLTRLQGLQRLELRRNKISSLPDDFANLKELVYLVLAENSFKEIPEVITRLPDLKELNFSDNSLRTLDKHMAALKALQTINLGSNKFSKFPIALVEMAGLVNLEFSHDGMSTGIAELPKEIGNLLGLQHLDLSAHPIVRLPESVGGLPLRILKVGGSKLTELPRSLTENEHLRELDLGFCENLTALPDDIGRWRHLRKLDLTRTKIKGLPASFVELQGLQDLSIGQTAIENEEALMEMLQALRQLKLVRLWYHPDKQFGPRLRKRFPNIEVRD